MCFAKPSQTNHSVVRGVCGDNPSQPSQLARAHHGVRPPTGSQCCPNLSTIVDGVSEGHVAFAMRTAKRSKLKY